VKRHRAADLLLGHQPVQFVDVGGRHIVGRDDSRRM
jgi:hypothetical protein